MGMRRTPGQRAGLTRTAVLTATRRLLTEDGLDALTMRGLARRLDVSPNALYSHVDSKAALIDGVLDDVLAEVDAPAADAEDPVAALRELMTSTHRVLLAHPDLVPLYLARQGAHGPNARGLGDVMTDLLARTGVSGPAARAALRVLIVYTIGFAAFTVQTDPVLGDESKGREGELGQNFQSGLRWLLAGIGATPEQGLSRRPAGSAGRDRARRAGRPG